MWTQIVGKVRMALSPPLNHWWHTTLYVNTRGLTTSPIPYGAGAFEIQFDFLDHQLEIRASGGQRDLLPLIPQAVAAFYKKLMTALHSMGISVSINTKPQEVPDPIPFEQDHKHAAYDREHAQRFWGSFDLACTRFSGLAAPPRKGVITSEAYSDECISAGFWPGAGLGAPAYYSYTAPQPPGLAKQPVRPGGWNTQLSEFILMYDDVRGAESPRTALLEFLESTYAAGARCANWDRRSLERG